MHRKLHVTALIFSGACAACLLVGGGCYRHVVSAEGPGTEALDVYEPALGDDEAPFLDPPAERAGEKPRQPMQPVVDPP